MGTANHRLAMSHGFQEHEAKPFTATGQGKHIAVRIACKKFILRKAGEKVSLILSTLLASKLFEPGPVLPITYENQNCIWHSRQNTGQR
jgi:hypothetical protein